MSSACLQTTSKGNNYIYDSQGASGPITLLSRGRLDWDPANPRLHRFPPGDALDWGLLERQRIHRFRTAPAWAWHGYRGDESLQSPSPYHNTGDHTIAANSAQYIYDHAGSKDKHLVTLHNSSHCLTVDTEWQEVAERTCTFIQSHVQ